MTALALLPQQDTRTGRDRPEVLTALIGAPSFDPLFRPDIIKDPAEPFRLPVELPGRRLRTVDDGAR
jgi:hypothetical protein